MVSEGVGNTREGEGGLERRHAQIRTRTRIRTRIRTRTHAPVPGERGSSTALPCSLPIACQHNEKRKRSKPQQNKGMRCVSVSVCKRRAEGIHRDWHASGKGAQPHKCEETHPHKKKLVLRNGCVLDVHNGFAVPFTSQNGPWARRD